MMKNILLNLMNGTMVALGYSVLINMYPDLFAIFLVAMTAHVIYISSYVAVGVVFKDVIKDYHNERDSLEKPDVQ